MRRVRRIAVAVAAALLLTAGAVVPAQAASAPTIEVQRLDPLQTDPVSVQVAVLGADGSAAAFSGTVTLTVGGTTASAGVAAASGGAAVARIATARLQSGSAVLRARLRVAGTARALTLRWFADIPPAVQVRGFSCTAVGPGGGPVRWAVDSLAGDPMRTPNSRDVPLLPYVGSSAPRLLMTDADGRPLTTTGTVTLLSGTRTVAVLPLRRAVRRLVFGVSWNGRVGGAFRPGAYFARLVLRDAVGRTSTAQQPVQVVAKGILPCGT